MDTAGHKLKVWTVRRPWWKRRGYAKMTARRVFWVRCSGCGWEQQYGCAEDRRVEAAKHMETARWEARSVAAHSGRLPVGARWAELKKAAP